MALCVKPSPSASGSTSGSTSGHACYTHKVSRQTIMHFEHSISSRGWCRPSSIIYRISCDCSYSCTELALPWTASTVRLFRWGRWLKEAGICFPFGCLFGRWSLRACYRTTSTPSQASGQEFSKLLARNPKKSQICSFFGLSLLIGITTEGSSTHQSAIATRACCQNTGWHKSQRTDRNLSPEVWTPFWPKLLWFKVEDGDAPILCTILWCGLSRFCWG